MLGVGVHESFKSPVSDTCKMSPREPLARRSSVESQCAVSSTGERKVSGNTCDTCLQRVGTLPRSSSESDFLECLQGASEQRIEVTDQFQGLGRRRAATAQGRPSPQTYHESALHSTTTHNTTQRAVGVFFHPFFFFFSSFVPFLPPLPFLRVLHNDWN